MRAPLESREVFVLAIMTRYCLKPVLIGHVLGGLGRNRGTDKTSLNTYRLLASIRRSNRHRLV